MSPADELAQHLATAGVGIFAGTAPDEWSINVSHEPPGPDDTVTLYDTAGLDPVHIEMKLRSPTIQVRVRSMTYRKAYAKQEQIRDLLVDPLSRTIGEHHYVGIWIQGNIGGIGRDDHDRQLLTANYRINRQPIGELS